MRLINRLISNTIRPAIDTGSQPREEGREEIVKRLRSHSAAGLVGARSRAL